MTECFELVYHGNGGFNWSDVWNMPVPHRRFSLNKIKEHLTKIQEIRDQQQNLVTENTDMKKFKLPEHVKELSKERQPTFVSKVKAKN
jgi:hypothetical protein